MPPRGRASEQPEFLSPSEWLRTLADDPATTGSSRGVCDDFFAEEPVPLDVFISDKKFIGMSPLSAPQADALRVAERVYYPEIYPHMQAEFGDYWEPIPMKNFLTLLVGKGGGKDLIARLMALRISYLLLCLKDPRDYFGMPSSESIHMLNVASTKDQARRAYFEPMTRIVRRGWFKDKCSPLKNTIEWERGLESVSGSSDAETQEGLNLILGVADEIDAFRTAEDIARTGGSGTRQPMRSAEGIIKMLRSSAATRFPRTFKNVRISYPRYHGSPILQLHAESKEDIERRGDASKHFIIGPMPSWEFNPLLARTTFVDMDPELSPVPVPEELVGDFEKEPEWARAAYLCMPERTMLPPYFRSENAVDSAMVDTPEIEVHWEFTRGAWHPRFVIPQSLQPAPGAVYACHGDLALNGDRAGFALAHVVSWDKFSIRDPETGGHKSWDERPVVKVDTALSLEADLEADPPREIQLRFYRQLVFELQERGFPIVSASLDGWQSVDSRQILEVGGIEAPLLSMDRTEEPYKMLRSLVEEGRVEIPFSRLLRNELLHLQQDPKKRKIDHPPGGCFTGDVRIPLLDGTYPQIKDLCGREVWVWSCTPTGQVVPGLARGRLTKYVAEFVDVILDNGYVARCTPEHPWMLRNGHYKMAKDLVPNEDRLMPITLGMGEYVRVTDTHGDRRWAHVLVAEFFAGRKALPSEIVHHKDENKLNNDPSNLEIVSREEHGQHHTTNRWKDDAAYAAAVTAGYRAWASDEDRKREAYAKRVFPTTRKFLRDDVTLDSFRAVADASNINQAAKRVGLTRNSAIARLKKAGYGSWEDFVAQAGSNHRVRAVIPVRISEPTPVFDLEVDEWDNFALTGGVFVHNSKDLADAVCGAVVTAVTTGGSELTTDSDEDSIGQMFSVSGLVGEAPVGAEDVWRSMSSSQSMRLPGL